ncbi:MAG: hypothetical protein ABI623_02815 [bacterium]
MEFWEIFWLIAFAFGFCTFSYISYRIITRGYAEVKSLLDQLKHE